MDTNPKLFWLFDQLSSINQINRSGTVHTLDYPAGKHTIEVRGTGAFVILGIVKP